jgi:glucose-1-phosphate adenylyltransferase
VLAATQTAGESGKKWFQGTADAVRQFLWLFEVLPGPCVMLYLSEDAVTISN